MIEANWQPLRIGNWQRDLRQLPIAIETISYGIGNALFKNPLPQACKLLILNQLAIGNFAYIEQYVANCVLRSISWRENQGSAVGFLSPGNGDAFNLVQPSDRHTPTRTSLSFQPAALPARWEGVQFCRGWFYMVRTHSALSSPPRKGTSNFWQIRQICLYGANGQTWSRANLSMSQRVKAITNE